MKWNKILGIEFILKKVNCLLELHGYILASKYLPVSL